MLTSVADRASTGTSKILVVDDHPLVRYGIASLVGPEDDIEICGEAANRNEALDLVRARQPDIVISDIVLDASSGLDFLKDMKTHHPDIPVLMISMYDESEYAERVFRAGARGFVNKRQFADALLVAIRQILSGETYISPEMQQVLANRYLGNGAVQNTELEIDVLTDRQLEVFRHVGRGRKAREIADRLNLSIKTIESHCEHIKRKLSLKSGIELVQQATLWVERSSRQ